MSARHLCKGCRVARFLQGVLISAAEAADLTTAYTNYISASDAQTFISRWNNGWQPVAGQAAINFPKAQVRGRVRKS
jgi:hypothetical protein